MNRKCGRRRTPSSIITEFAGRGFDTLKMTYGTVNELVVIDMA